MIRITYFWHFLQKCMLPKPWKYFLTVTKIFRVMLPKFWYFQQKCMQMHVGNWHQHAYLHAHGCTCIQHACSISLLKWPKMHAFFKKCMHFSKMHAPFTYKMHAFMHAFLQKVSIMFSTNLRSYVIRTCLRPAPDYYAICEIDVLYLFHLIKHFSVDFHSFNTNVIHRLIGKGQHWTNTRKTLSVLVAAETFGSSSECVKRPSFRSQVTCWGDCCHTELHSFRSVGEQNDHCYR